jgi:hypothetical protein
MLSALSFTSPWTLLCFSTSISVREALNLRYLGCGVFCFLVQRQGLVWQCRVTRRCRVRGWFGVGLARGLLACPVRLKKVPLIQKQDPRVP